MAEAGGIAVALVRRNILTRKRRSLEGGAKVWMGRLHAGKSATVRPPIGFMTAY